MKAVSNGAHYRALPVCTCRADRHVDPCVFAVTNETCEPRGSRETAAEPEAQGHSESERGAAI